MRPLFGSSLGRSLSGEPAEFGKAVAAAPIAPVVEIREKDKKIIFGAELRGIDEKNVDVVVRDGVLSL